MYTFFQISQGKKRIHIKEVFAMPRRRTNIGSCTARGCSRPQRAEHLCMKHYQRSLRARPCQRQIEQARAKWTAEGLSWAAGLLEGEGSFHVANAYGKWGGVRMSVTSTDLDVLEKLHLFLGMGAVYGPTPPARAHYKPQWQWRLSRRELVQALCEAMRPLMCSRRKQQIDAMIESISRHAQRRRGDSD